MKFTDLSRMPFWQFISTPLTNLGRAKDSNEKSTANVELQEAMINSGGWSPEFPNVAVSMKNWPFEKSATRPMGCTAQEYINDEMKRRETLQTFLATSTDKNDEIKLKAFTALYCNDKGELHKLTLKNAYWTNSGHQRTEFVYLNAYALYLQRLDERSKSSEADAPLVPEWDLTIPTLVGTYEDELDILRNQLSSNASASKQNRLTLLDYLKAAVAAIGCYTLIKITERQFRNICAIPGKMSDKGGNSGAAPRHAYILAYINWLYEGKLEFYKKLLAEPKVKNKAGEEVDNPEYIDISEVALSHEDPMCNASVILRLMEPSQQRLKEYVKNYGKRSSNVEAERLADPVSAIEYEIHDREYCWTLQEAQQWVRSKCKGAGAGIYKAPVVAKKAEPFKFEVLEGPVNSESNPGIIRDIISELAGIPKPVPGAKASVVTGTEAKKVSRKGPLDFVWYAESPYELMLLECIESASRLKDGDPAKFETVVTQFKASLDACHTPVA